MPPSFGELVDAIGGIQDGSAPDMQAMSRFMLYHLGPQAVQCNANQRSPVMSDLSLEATLDQLAKNISQLEEVVCRMRNELRNPATPRTF